MPSNSNDELPWGSGNGYSNYKGSGGNNKNPLLALIPARGGSKGIPGKNMVKVKGVPLIGYTIESAIDSKFVSEIFISSDDNLTLQYGKDAGVQLIRRPSKYSSDVSSANDVVNHFISVISKKLIEKDPYIIYLQPTSPLRTSAHIDHAFEKMIDAGLHKLVSVVEMKMTPFKAFKLDDKGNLQVLFNENMTNKRRQDLPQTYLANGAIYIFRVSDFIKDCEFPSNGSYPYIMSELDSLDIDTNNDLEILNQRL